MPLSSISARHRFLSPPLLLAGWSLLLVGCHREPAVVPPASLPAAAVRTAVIESRGYVATEEVVGTVRARLRAAVEAKVAGRIETLPVVPGQLVKPGDTIATLDAREARARLDQAVALREQAERDLARMVTLVKDGAVTQADFDAAQARQRVARAAVTEAETFLGHTQIAAPFAGVITRKFADVGDLATPGRPIVELEDPGALRFEADVPEALLERMPMGAHLPVRVSALKEAVTGTVSEVAPVAESVSRTYLVKRDLPAMAGLRAGQFGRVAVPTGEASVPQVPVAAVVQRGQLEYVFVVADGHAHLRLVRTGRRLADSLELVAGAGDGEKVVISGVDKLKDGQPVREQ